MTLDEAIKHCKEKAKELSDKAYREWGVSMTEEEAYDCNECAREHEQLGKWLEDYKRLLEGRPQGKWVYRNDNPLIPSGYYECDRCEIGKSLTEQNYCPNCGADMRGEK